MADCSGEFPLPHVIYGAEADDMRLSEALTAGNVVAHCGCGCVEPVEVRWWRSSTFDLGSRLSTLARRVRCTCGAKDLHLEVWSVAPAVQRRRTYLWRA